MFLKTPGMRNRRAKSARPRRRPFIVQALEERTLLSTFTVTKLNDTNDGACDADCSLREAVIAANSNPGADTIAFALNGTFELSIAGNDDAAAVGDLDLTGDVTIAGAGATDTIIDANNIDRAFQVLAGVNAQFSQLTITGGAAAGNGGGIYNSGTVTLTGSTLSGNSVPFNSGRGAGIYNNSGGTVTIADSTLWANSAYYGGGIFNLGALTIGNSTLSENWAIYDTGRGGALFNDSGGTATITHSTLSENSASAAGVFWNFHGTVTITDSTLSENSSDSIGGAFYNYFDSTVTLTNTTLSRNSGNFGGAIYNDGNLTATNSTLSENSAGDYYGGGIYNFGTVMLTNATLVANSAKGGGGILNYPGGSITSRNSIIAGNTASSDHPDVFGAYLSLGHNLIGNVAAATGFTHGVLGDQVGTSAAPIDPLLTPLQDNGGPTWTHALSIGSPAIDVGDNTAAPPTDQRGFPRIVDGDLDGTATIDIGAVESAAVEGGVVRISGTAAGDEIVVTHTANGVNLRVTLNGVVLSEAISLAHVLQIHVWGHAGDDNMTLLDLAKRSLLSGGPGSDQLTGGGRNDTMLGGDGNDTLRGQGGQDQLFGGAGNDLVDGGSGNDTLHGDAGNDTLMGKGGDDHLFGDAGNDRWYFQGTNLVDYLDVDWNALASALVGHRRLTNGGAPVETDVASGIERLAVRGLGDNDHLSLTSFTLADHVAAGLVGLITLDGAAGDDTILGSGGNDSLIGGAGHDRLFGGDGKDTLDAGAGNDTLLGDRGNDSLLAGDGDDLMEGGPSNDTLDGGSGSDTINGAAGTDTCLNGEFVTGCEL